MTHSLFYVYSQEDAPDASLGKPSVSFQSLEFEISDPTSGFSEYAYQGLQVGLFPFDDLWKLVKKDAFCSTEGRLMLADGTVGTDSESVHLHTVEFGAEGESNRIQPETHGLRKTGKYMLVISNCGKLTGAVITGKVAVQNPFGYLPAHEHGTLHFYGWLALAHVVLNFLWLSVQIKELKHMHAVQRGLTLVTVTAMLEVVFAYATLKHENLTGARHDVLLMVFLLCDAMKYINGGWLIMYLAVGVGIGGLGADAEESQESMPFTSLLVTMFFAAQQCVWRMLMCHRSSIALNPGFLVLNTLPGMLIFAVFFWWVLRKLSTLIEALTEQKQTTSLAVFIRWRKALIVGMCMSVVVSSIQLADVFMNDLATWTWRYTWFPQDGAAHVLFLLSLVGMMAIWRPGEASRSFGYSSQATDDVDASHADPPDRVVLDMSDGEEERRHEPPVTDDDPLDSPKHTNAVAPEPIGARQDEPTDLLDEPIGARQDEPTDLLN